MSDRPRLLDLFCGAGGCAAGYVRAGFEVHGVDIQGQPRYLASGAVSFTQADALEYLAAHGREFDAIHASPPCQGYSRMRYLPWLKDKRYPLLIEPLREILASLGRPWVIENVEDAPLRGVLLCGIMFGLKVYRHRLFECSHLLWQPHHPPHKVKIGVNGSYRFNDKREPTADGWVSLAGKGTRRMTDAARAAFGVEWMATPHEVSQAIPPAYCEYLGRQLREIIHA